MARVDLDPGFGGDGRVLTVPGASTSGVREVVRTSGGYVYAYGQAGDTRGGHYVRRTVVARYLHDGTPDPAWGAGGRAHGGDVLGGAPSEGGLVVGANLTATVASSSTSGQVVLERFTSDRASRRGLRPRRRRAYTLPDGARARVAGLVRQSTGNLVVAGHVEHGGRRLFAMRLNADGTPRRELRHRRARHRHHGVPDRAQRVGRRGERPVGRGRRVRPDPARRLPPRQRPQRRVRLPPLERRPRPAT